VLHHYTQCDQSRMNPFIQNLREAQRAVDAMTATNNMVSRIAKELYRTPDLDQRLLILSKDINYVTRYVHTYIWS